jgi:hypothetical protein
MQVFIGVLIAGGRNWKKLHISEMWTENELFKQPYFTAVLSKNRFKEIYMQLEMTELKQLETNWKQYTKHMTALSTALQIFLQAQILQ